MCTQVSPGNSPEVDSVHEGAPGGSQLRALTPNTHTCWVSSAVCSDLRKRSRFFLILGLSVRATTGCTRQGLCPEGLNSKAGGGLCGLPREWGARGPLRLGGEAGVKGATPGWGCGLCWAPAGVLRTESRSGVLGGGPVGPLPSEPCWVPRADCPSSQSEGDPWGLVPRESPRVTLQTASLDERTDHLWKSKAAIADLGSFLPHVEIRPLV